MKSKISKNERVGLRLSLFYIGSSYEANVRRTKRVEPQIYLFIDVCGGTNCLNTNIYSYLETSGGQSSNLYFYFCPGVTGSLPFSITV
jgi:hypothetical protein